MTDVEATTIRNVLEDLVPYRFLQTTCTRITRSSATHSFVVVVSAEGVPMVLVRRRAQP